MCAFTSRRAPRRLRASAHACVAGRSSLLRWQSTPRAIAAACRAIETAETPPRLETLARRAALSPFHFLRVFREVTGLTPRQYAAAHRAQRLREALRPGATSVIDAGLAAGFGSAAGLHAAADGALGMTRAIFVVEAQA